MLQFKIELNDGQYIILNETDDGSSVEVVLYDSEHEKVSSATISSDEMRRMSDVLIPRGRL